MKKKFDKKAYEAFMAIGGRNPTKPPYKDMFGENSIFEDLQNIMNPKSKN